MSVGTSTPILAPTSEPCSTRRVQAVICFRTWWARSTTTLAASTTRTPAGPSAFATASSRMTAPLARPTCPTPKYIGMARMAPLIIPCTVAMRTCRTSKPRGLAHIDPRVPARWGIPGTLPTPLASDTDNDARIRLRVSSID